MGFYDFSVLDDKGHLQDLNQFENRVVLIVNTATACGLTPQYEQLEKLYEEFSDEGFVVLDFPCNQFLEQAPGTIEEINEFCSLNYHTTFPRFAKLSVNGDDADPLFVYLKEQAPNCVDDDEAETFYKRVEGYTPDLQAGDIRWNFNKFLIGKDGNVIARFSPSYDPSRLEDAIKEALSA